MIARRRVISKRERREQQSTSFVAAAGSAETSAATSSAAVPGGENDLRSSSSKQRRRVRRKYCGEANVEWRAVPAEHLRAHPGFSPLPRAHAVRTLSSWRDVSNFEQQSVQWNMLHEGRLTTSRMAAAMGLLEPAVAEDVLGVPRGLRGSSRAHAAFTHLIQVPARPLETLDDAAALLVDTSLFTNEEDYLALMQRDLEHLDADRKRLWKADRRYTFRGGGRLPSTASLGLFNGDGDGCRRRTYAEEKERFLKGTLQKKKKKKKEMMMKTKHQQEVKDTDGREMHRKLPPLIYAAGYNGIVSEFAKSESRRSGTSHRRARGARMAWGSVHEATAVLTALNHFHQSARDALVLECGMFPSEGLLESGRHVNNWEHAQLKLLLRCREDGLRLGASPDGILVHRGEELEDASVNGDPSSSSTLVVEALEVKNHSPFVSAGRGRMAVRDRPPPAEVPPWYVPQLQLEMMMIGPHCRSAIFVRLSATQGACILRIPRDDEYIVLMLTRALIFHRRFVATGTKPHTNFGFGTEEEAREKEEDIYREIRDVLADEDIDFSVRAVAEQTRAVAATASLVRRVQHREVQRARPSSVPLLF